MANEFKAEVLLLFIESENGKDLTVPPVFSHMRK
jgi:hypothetical protein